MSPTTTWLPRLRSSFAKAFLALLAYLLTVCGGLLVSLLLISAIGYLPYTDRPGPGWHEMHVPTGGEIQFYFGFVWFLAVTTGWYQWLLMYAAVGSLAWAGAPRWLVRTVGALLGAFGTLLAVAAAGWYIALAGSIPQIGGLLGMAYGALILPRFVPKEKSARPWKLVISAVVATGVLGLWIYPWLR